MELYGIVGAGGFGREVMPVAHDMLSVFPPAAGFELVFVVDHGDTAPVNGRSVLTTDEFLGDLRPKHFNIAIADHEVRRRLAERLLALGVAAFTIRAPNSVELGPNDIGDGAILCPFTTITANARIGRFFHANLYSYVAHDCVIGDFVTFAPNVHCNGRVVIEDGAYIGTGALLRQGSEDKPLVIGRGAVVGMGAVVTRDVAPFTTVVGNPAALLTRRPA